MNYEDNVTDGNRSKVSIQILDNMAKALEDDAKAVEMFKAGVADYVIKDENLHFIRLLPKIVHHQIKHKRMMKEFSESLEKRVDQHT